MRLFFILAYNVWMQYIKRMNLYGNTECNILKDQPFPYINIAN